jgi:hypothetical protein
VNQVEYDLTFDDYVAFNHQHSERMFAMRTVRMALQLIFGMSVPIGVAYYLLTRSAPMEVAAFLIIWSVGNLAIFTCLALWWHPRSPPFTTRWLVWWYMSRGDTSSVFGRHWLAISPQDIYERSPKAESRLNMSSVQRIALTPNHAFVYISPMHAFIIPRRAFITPEMFDAFIATLEQYSGLKAESS